MKKIAPMGSVELLSSKTRHKKLSADHHNIVSPTVDVSEWLNSIKKMRVADYSLGRAVWMVIGNNYNVKLID